MGVCLAIKECTKRGQQLRQVGQDWLAFQSTYFCLYATVRREFAARVQRALFSQISNAQQLRYLHYSTGLDKFAWLGINDQRLEHFGRNFNKSSEQTELLNLSALEGFASQNNNYASLKYSCLQCDYQMITFLPIAFCKQDFSESNLQLSANCKN